MIYHKIYKHDLQKILAWFIHDYFFHNFYLISLARKSFQPQNSDDETILADETYYVWYPDWSHPLFIDIPTDFSSEAITTVSISRDYVRITPLIIDATLINYNSVFTERARNSREINSKFINQENLNGTRNLTQQDILSPSFFVNEKIVETIPTTTQQQQIFPIHPTLTTPKNKNAAFPETTIQPTVKSSVIPKSSQMDYQTIRPVTTPRQTNKQKTSNRNNFSDHNYNFFPKIQNLPI